LQYVVGTIVEATSTNVQGFGGGAVLFQFGYSAAILMMEVVISDLTSLRSRLLFSYIPGAQIAASPCGAQLTPPSPCSCG